MEKTKVIYKSSIGTFPIFLLFLILKLTGVITWPWLWVTSPLWIPYAFALACFLLFVGFAFISLIVAAIIGAFS